MIVKFKLTMELVYETNEFVHCENSIQNKFNFTIILITGAMNDLLHIILSHQCPVDDGLVLTHKG